MYAQLTPEQHECELDGSTDMPIFSDKYSNEFSLSYDFLSNIFFLLAYFIVITQYIQNMYQSAVYVISKASRQQ